MLSMASKSPCPFLVRSFFLYCPVGLTAGGCLAECGNSDDLGVFRGNGGAARLDIGLSWDLSRSGSKVFCFNVSGVHAVNRKQKIGLGIAAFALASVIGIFAADQWILRDPKILPGVHVANVDVGGLEPNEAETKLETAIQPVLSAPILITDSRQIWPVQPSDIDFSVDVKRSVATAYSSGREDDLVRRWVTLLTGESRPVLHVPVSVNINRDKLGKLLTALALKTDREARDASLQVSLQNKRVNLIPAVEGRKLNIEKTLAQAFKSPQQQLSFQLDLVFDQQIPRITDAHYAGIDSILASYSTYFKPWDADRNANLRLATNRIHGQVLKPGEMFSYNAIVGHRNQKEGFRMAPVILDGKLVPDWGGGVCQVSSTLYNAALLADLEIVDRSNHGRAIGYVPLGFDATVVDGQIDFKFKNNLKRSIMIYSTVTEDELIFSVLGNVADSPPPIELDYVVHKVIEPVEIKQPDPTLEVGKEVIDESPQRGFRVSTYRIRTINGKQVSQLLFTDDYDPVNRIVKVGTKPNGEAASANSAPAKKPSPAQKPDAPTKKPVTSGKITLKGVIPQPSVQSPSTPTR